MSPAAERLIRINNLELKRLSVPDNMSFINKWFILSYLSSEKGKSQPLTEKLIEQAKITVNQQSSKNDNMITTNEIDIKDSLKNLMEYKMSLPHIYLNISCNVDNLVELINKLNSKIESKLANSNELRIHDFVVKVNDY